MCLQKNGGWAVSFAKDGKGNPRPAEKEYDRVARQTI